ncbi:MULTISPECIES: hypothetical protein [unclassified Streptomyces]|uniref:hypothetical protein n=1 Tax=unclassified Streptomyces TaxID=2593676 RepID=UPI0035DDDE3B
MTAITVSDRRRWQWAALDVLGTITADAPALAPLNWTVFATAQLMGEPDVGATADRLDTLRQWARHLGIDMTERPGLDGVVTHHGSTELTAKNGKSVTVALHLRTWPDEDEDLVDADAPRDPVELDERIAAEWSDEDE